MKKLILTVAVLLAFAVPASAELKMPESVFIVAAASDWAMTYHHCSMPGFATSPVRCEGNPLVSGLSKHPAAMVLTGAAIDAATLYGWAKLTKAHHPTLYTVGLYAAASVRLTLVGLTVRQQRRDAIYFASHP